MAVAPEARSPEVAGSAGLHVDPGKNGQIEVRDCTVIGADVGIALPKGANVKMSGNKFVDVRTPVKFYDK
jgi:nitrous oxidase accessory protein NosD